MVKILKSNKLDHISSKQFNQQLCGNKTHQVSQPLQGKQDKSPAKILRKNFFQLSLHVHSKQLQIRSFTNLYVAFYSTALFSEKFQENSRSTGKITVFQEFFRALKNNIIILFEIHVTFYLLQTNNQITCIASPHQHTVP